MRRCVFTLGAWLIGATILRAEPPAESVVMYESGGPAECGRQRCGIYGSGEVLLWWIKDSPAPVPLVTAGPTGLIDDPSTTVLLGGGDVDNEDRTGIRFTIGWLDPSESWGFEASYLFAEHTVVQTVGSDLNGFPQLFIPFFDVTQPSGEAVTNLSDPSSDGPLDPPFSGQAVLEIFSRLQGAEANLVAPRLMAGGARVTFLAGFRYLELREVLNFNTSSPNVIDPPMFPVQPGSIFSTEDRFTADNDFFGGQVGVRAEWFRDRWSLRAAGKIALGCVQQQVDIGGLLVTNLFLPGPGFEVFQGGYFAQPTNIGRSTSDRFAVVPEVSIDAGFQVTRAVRLYAGYTFLYLSEAVRPGDQIDRRINPSQSPAINGLPVTPADPPFPVRTITSSDFWAQGLHFGVEIRY